MKVQIKNEEYLKKILNNLKKFDFFISHHNENKNKKIKKLLK
jgi:hypothetical protein